MRIRTFKMLLNFYLAFQRGVDSVWVSQPVYSKLCTYISLHLEMSFNITQSSTFTSNTNHTISYTILKSLIHMWLFLTDILGISLPSPRPIGAAIRSYLSSGESSLSPVVMGPPSNNLNSYYPSKLLYAYRYTSIPDTDRSFWCDWHPLIGLPKLKCLILLRKLLI